MKKKISVTFTEVDDKEEKMEKFTEILSEGFYEYLKKSGLLRKNPEKQKKIEEVLENVQRIQCNRLMVDSA